MSNQALTSLSAVQQYLGLSSGVDEALLSDLIARASAGACSYCGREFAAADYYEFHDGEGTEAVLLEQRPVTAVFALSDDGAEIAADEYVVYPEAGIVRLASGTFGHGARTVYAGYRAGYETLPGEVEQAVVAWTAELYQSREVGGRPVASERVGDYAVTYEGESTANPSRRVRAALEPYRVALARAVR